MILERNKIYLGDCLDLMGYLESESIDMIFCDLPFGTTKCAWDSLIDLSQLWKHYRRIIKPNGAILLFGQTPFDKILGCSNLEWLRYEWIWEKTQATGFFNAKKMPMKAHENVLVFYKKVPVFNPIKTTGHKPMNSYTKRAQVQNKTQVYGKVLSDVSGGGNTDRYPRSVITFSSDKQKTKLNGTIFPTQKPLALCEYLIKSYTNKGDLILDNCAGSGTTGLAAKNTGRDYILIEKEVEYYELCKRRIENNLNMHEKSIGNN